jgi:hypothetical protein
LRKWIGAKTRRKIYVYLLRLFPSGFRKRYEEESLRLLRDRLNDERGFFRRLRLSFDLLADVIGALPQAYANSYAEVAPVASLPAHFDGIPSFQVLSKEPIQRGTILLAGVLAVTAAFATIACLMEPTTPYPPAAHNGRISPVQSVLERLNEPISPDTEASVSSEPFEPASRDVEPASAAKAAPVATQTALSGAKNARAVAIPLFAFGNASRGATLSGRWTTSLRPAGRDADVPHDFAFRQINSELSGTGQADSGDRFPITRGLVAGDSVRFELDHGQRRFLYDLTLQGRELRGTLSIRSANENLTGQVRLERGQ